MAPVCMHSSFSLQLSSQGAIVTRLASIEEMAGMNMLCSDKTGTLTLNKMVIQDDCPIYTPGVTKDDVLQSAALAAKWKEPPRDALDTLVLRNSGLDLTTLDVYEQVGPTTCAIVCHAAHREADGEGGGAWRLETHYVSHSCRL